MLNKVGITCISLCLMLLAAYISTLEAGSTTERALEVRVDGKVLDVDVAELGPGQSRTVREAGHTIVLTRTSDDISVTVDGELVQLPDGKALTDENDCALKCTVFVGNEAADLPHVDGKGDERHLMWIDEDGVESSIDLSDETTMKAVLIDEDIDIDALQGEGKKVVIVKKNCGEGKDCCAGAVGDGEKIMVTCKAQCEKGSSHNCPHAQGHSHGGGDACPHAGGEDCSHKVIKVIHKTKQVEQ